MARMFVTVRGRQHEWSFQFDGNPDHLEEWRADGLEVNEVEYVVPYWVAAIGLAEWWCFAQALVKKPKAWRHLR